MSERFTAGAQVDDYEIIRTLGQGGMGVVYAAQDRRIGRVVALKFLHATGVDADVLHEARQSAVTHENIVEVHRIGEWAGHPFIVFEYLDGETLHARLARGALSEGEALRVALALARALDAVHQNGQIHRDLKPKNVMLGADGRVKLLDFGISSRIDQARALASTATARAGTPRYMAPEQHRGEALDAACDIWALGLILHQMLTGRLPHGGDGRAVELAERRQAPPIDLTAPPFSAGTVALASGCLQVDPRLRPRAGDAVERLAALCAAARGGRDARRCPFVGLQSFSEEDQALYFGREDDVERVYRQLHAHRTVVLAARSGAGKSSMIRAGLLPRLRADQARVLLLRPGRDPWLGIARRIVEVTATTLGTDSISFGTAPTADASASPAEDHPRSPVAALASALRADEAALSREVAVLLDQRPGQIVFCLDQLEELFTQTGAADQATAVLRAFARCLAASPRVAFIGCVRLDYLGELQAVANGLALDQPSPIVLPVLRPTALRAALLRPLEASSARFEDAALVDEIVQAVATHPSALPLLQFTARQLWEACAGGVMRRDTYRQMGGVAGALGRHADDVLSALIARTDVATDVAMRLTSADGTRRIVAADEISTLGPDGRMILDQLIDARLVIRTIEPGGGEQFEFVHDAIIEHSQTLQRWRRVRSGEWSAREDLENAARAWAAERGSLWRGRRLKNAVDFARSTTLTLSAEVPGFLAQSRKRSRRTRTALWALAALFVALGFVVVALWRQASRDAQKAFAKQIEAELSAARSALGRGAMVEARARTNWVLQTEPSNRAAAVLAWRLFRAPLLWRKSVGGWVDQAAVRPGHDTVLIGTERGVVHLIDPVTEDERIHTMHATTVYGLAWSPSGDLFATGDNSGLLVVTRADAAPGEGAEVARLRLLDANGAATGVRHVAFGADDHTLAAALGDGSVQRLRLVDGELRRVERLHNPGKLKRLTFLDGALLAFGEDFLRVHGDTAKGPPALAGLRRARALQVRDGRVAFLSVIDGAYRLHTWREDEGWTLVPGAGRARAGFLAIDAAGHLVGQHHHNGWAHLHRWHGEGSEELAVFHADPRDGGLLLDPDRGVTYTRASSGGHIAAWQMRPDQDPDPIAVEWPTLPTISRLCGMDGRVISAAPGPTIRVTDLADGASTLAVAEQGGATALACHPTQPIFVRKERQAIRFHRVEDTTRAADRRWSRCSIGVRSVVGLAFSPDGRRLAIGTNAGVTIATAPEVSVLHPTVLHTLIGRLIGLNVRAPDCRFRRLPDLEPRDAKGIRAGEARKLAFGRPGVLFFLGRASGRVYRARFDDSGWLGVDQIADIGAGEDLAVSRDGATVVIASDGDQISVVDAETLERRALGRHPTSVATVDLSPDGQRVVTGGDDGLTRVWSIAGEVVVDHRAQHGDIWDVQWLSNERYAIGGDDGVATAIDVAVRQTRDAAGPVLASATTDRWRVRGLRRGLIEVESVSGADAQVRLEGVPPVAVTALASIPDYELIVAGFASGAYGVWSLESGARLHHSRTVGAVRSIVVEEGMVAVHGRGLLEGATDLPPPGKIDLTTLAMEDCARVRRFARHAPLWKDGRAVRAKLPEEHVCWSAR